MKWFDNWLYSKYKDRIIKHDAVVLREKFSPYNKELAYTDSNNVRYFRIIGEKQPLERIGRSQDILIKMSSSLSDTELTELVTLISNEMAKGFAGKPINHIRIGSLLDEIDSRKYMILHHELMYNFLAVNYIREDEPVGEWVESIHYEKVVQFKKDNKSDEQAYFFFQTPELRLVNEMLKLSKEEWIQSWRDSHKEVERLNRKAQYLRGKIESESFGMTAKPLSKSSVKATQ